LIITKKIVSLKSGEHYTPLSTPVRILNFDSSITRQTNLLRRFHPTIVDLQHLGPACRLSMNDAMAQEVRRVLAPELKSTITLLGSGDFHHVSSLLIEQFTDPISVIVFDHHPDWSMLPPPLHCGSWVTHVLRRPNVKKLVLFGVSSDDISCPWIQYGNLQALKDDRVEIYPGTHRPTRVFLRRVPHNRSVSVRRGLLSSTITWQELRSADVTTGVSQVVKRLSPKQVYVSIDKDCLRADASLTNWEAGDLRLEELVQFLTLIRQELEIVGLDVVGDYSPPQVRGSLKALIGRLDRPNAFSANGKPEVMITAVNEQTNLRLLDVLTHRAVPPALS